MYQIVSIMYTRGHGRQKIFRDEQDFSKFLELLRRYLSLESATAIPSVKKLYDDISLNCYCLMEHKDGPFSNLFWIEFFSIPLFSASEETRQVA